MSVHDAQTGDIYQDEQGCVWVVIGRWNEPVVIAEQIWPNARHGESEPPQATGGISGLMWKGWKRIAQTHYFRDRP